MSALLPLALIAGAYLIGSIPFSWFVARLASGKDIRTVGSGNVGATNVARSVGRVPGLIALLLDGVKGWAAVFLAQVLLASGAWPELGWLQDAPSFWVGVSAVAAILGHMFPVWLGFHGGKGVATAAGIFLALSPLSFLIALVIFLLVWISTKLVSLGSILSAAAMPMALRFVEHSPFWTVIAGIVIAIAIILKHRSNIARMAAGEEPRFPK